jgi:hypothetical protein
MTYAGTQYVAQALMWLLVWAFAGLNVRQLLMRREMDERNERKTHRS